MFDKFEKEFQVMAKRQFKAFAPIAIVGVVFNLSVIVGLIFLVKWLVF